MSTKSSSGKCFDNHFYFFSGFISGPFHDEKSIEDKIFRPRIRFPKYEPPLTTYLAANVKIGGNLKGSEVASRTYDITNICGNLFAINVTLNFQNLMEDPMRGSALEGIIPDSYATPSNLELTIGKCLLLYIEVFCFAQSSTFNLIVSQISSFSVAPWGCSVSGWCGQLRRFGPSHD